MDPYTEVRYAACVAKQSLDEPAARELFVDTLAEVFADPTVSATPQRGPFVRVQRPVQADDGREWNTLQGWARHGYSIQRGSTAEQYAVLPSGQRVALFTRDQVETMPADDLSAATWITAEQHAERKKAEKSERRKRAPEGALVKLQITKNGGNPFYTVRVWCSGERAKLVLPTLKQWFYWFDARSTNYATCCDTYGTRLEPWKFQTRGKERGHLRRWRNYKMTPRAIDGLTKNLTELGARVEYEVDERPTL